MRSDFHRALARTLELEGGWSNHPKDRGGKTMFGVTEGLARDWGYKGDMRDLSKDTAESIYFDMFWKPMGLEWISTKAPSLAMKLFDIGVNVGSKRAMTWMQMVLNSFNLQESRFADVAEDGAWGPRTRGALETFLTWRGADGEIALMKGITCLQGHHYIDISRRRPDNEEFTYGWISKRISL